MEVSDWIIVTGVTIIAAILAFLVHDIVKISLFRKRLKPGDEVRFYMSKLDDYYGTVVYAEKDDVVIKYGQNRVVVQKYKVFPIQRESD